MGKESLFDGLIQTEDQFPEIKDRQVARAVVYLLLGEGGKLIVPNAKALEQLFSDSGFETEFHSWNGRNRNPLVLLPSQIEKILGEAALGTLLQLTGMSKHELLDQLVFTLPKVIREVTPYELELIEHARTFHSLLSSLLKRLR